MTTPNITLPFVDDTAVSDAEEIWVRLEQDKMPDIDNFLDFSDIYQMWLMVKNRESAFWYLESTCPIKIESDRILVYLDFFSYPSHMDLNYQVQTSLGTLSEPTRFEEEREFDIKFELKNKVTLPYVVSDVEITPTSRAIHPTRGEIDFPSYTVDGSIITLSEECFAVCRVKCKVHGFLHTVTLEFVKEETTEDEDGNVNTTGYKIENIQCTEIANWVNEEGEAEEETLDLEIPHCVEQYLGLCGDGGGKTTIVDQGAGEYQVVYWSVCSNKVIAVFTEGGEEE